MDAVRREQFAHVLRAASKIADDREILVIGSQSILGTYSEDELPDEAQASIEVDVTFFDDMDNAKSDRVDAFMGEDSQFHATFGYYAQGVDLTTATPPACWQQRVVRYESPGADGAVALCMDPHDLVCAKLAAFREKDKRFSMALLDAGIVDLDVLLARAATLEVPLVSRNVTSWLLAWGRKYQPRGTSTS
ncbi:DUF6036 family nucleotidyltransferase [Humibacillus xanthopallidus]|uniref:DUF6036 family nucleotidyltransferase n=1 Tax=Humibacillus xanthopallidus TaxID=412689 RepID=UPI001C89ECBB|nr:DUF6036 family nucleotidyltransferase [Humibacillus xanthopallidus]